MQLTFDQPPDQPDLGLMRRVAMWQLFAGGVSEQLLFAIDRALYCAKDAGRGRVEVCIDDALLAKSADRL